MYVYSQNEGPSRLRRLQSALNASLNDPDVASNFALPSSGEQPKVATRIANLT